MVAPDDALAERVARYRVLKHLQANATLSPPQGLKPAEVKEQMMAWHNETETIEAELNRAFAKKHASQLGDIGNLAAELCAATTRSRYCPGRVRPGHGP